MINNIAKLLQGLFGKKKEEETVTLDDTHSVVTVNAPENKDIKVGPAVQPPLTIDLTPKPKLILGDAVVVKEDGTLAPANKTGSATGTVVSTPHQPSDGWGINGELLNQEINKITQQLIDVGSKTNKPINREKFYNAYRKKFGKLAEPTVKTLEAIIDVFNDNPVPTIKPIEKYAYMLATVRAEVGPKMVPIVENMNYTAKRIMQVWPSRFKTLASAQPYANNPEKLGNYVYGNRLGNGPASSGDGYRYRGRGIGAQFTGRVNYEKFSKLMGIDLINYPQLAMDEKIGAQILKKGCLEGLFTGVGLDKYINERKTDYVNARRVVNADVSRMGQRIANDAVKFESILKEAWEK